MNQPHTTEEINLEKYSIPELEAFLLKWIKNSENAGMKYARGKSLYETISDKQKPILAKLEISCGLKTQGDKKSFALAAKEYDDFLKGLSAAREDYLMSLVSYDNAKLKVDCLRTIISARKEEIKRFAP